MKHKNIENTDTQKNYYAGLINTWTVSDVLARNTALQKLNFIEFFRRAFHGLVQSAITFFKIPIL